MRKFVPRFVFIILVGGYFFCVSRASGQIEPTAQDVAAWREVAERGWINAQVNLASAYYNGQGGLPQNYEEAVKWYRMAAEQGNVIAQYNLWNAYHNGLGVRQNVAEAIKWLRKAADQDFAPAQCNLGTAYRNGQGVTQNDMEAVKWYRRGAEQKNADPQAQINLGRAYEFGRGVSKDAAEAVYWYRKAAQQGYPNGQYALGSAYMRGSGVPKSPSEAAKWWRKAADQGFGDAQRDLGVCYDHGEGVVKNEVEGYKWTLLAAAKGDEVARENMLIIESNLSVEQLKQGKILAQRWEAGREIKPDDQPETHTEFLKTGTGFLITQNGYLVTNHHVVKDCDRVRVQTASGLLDAVVIRTDAASDLALLKVTGAFNALPVVSSRIARLGTTVATVGFPNIGLQGFEPKLSKGDISSLSGIQDDVRYFQVSAPVQPGNSGGALFDERGNVLGVISAQLSQKAALESSGTLAQSVNYAVKSSFLLSFLEAVPEVSDGLLEAKTADQKFEAVVDDVKKATVLIIGY